jgi:hypothetical protein
MVEYGKLGFGEFVTKEGWLVASAHQHNLCPPSPFCLATLTSARTPSITNIFPFQSLDIQYSMQWAIFVCPSRPVVWLKQAWPCIKFCVLVNPHLAITMPWIVPSVASWKG